MDVVDTATDGVALDDSVAHRDGGTLETEVQDKLRLRRYCSPYSCWKIGRCLVVYEVPKGILRRDGELKHSALKRR